MQFRPVTIEDIDAVEMLAIEGMRPHLYSGHLVPQKIRAAIAHFAKSKTDFNLVAFEDGKPVGAIAAFSNPSMWFERHDAYVCMCFTKRPNIGAHMIDALMKWVDRSFNIRGVIWPQEFDSRPGFARLLRRYGFKPQTMCVYRKD